MARIPLGQFGNVVAEPVAPPSRAGLGQAINRAGQTLTNIGLQAVERDQEFARTKDANSLLDYQLAVKGLEGEFKDKIATGGLHYDQAQKEWQGAVAKIPKPKPTANSRDHAENLTRATDRLLVGSDLAIGNYSVAARNEDNRAQAGQMFDKLGKLAGLPGADIETINQQYDGIRVTLEQAGVPADQAARAVQERKDQNWANEAINKTMLAREDMGKLKQLEHDLTAKDGYYVGKLDTDKRNIVLNQVITHRIQLENRLEAHADKREAAGVRAVNTYESQIANGVPTTAADKAKLQNAVKGTTSEPAFNELLQEEVKTQAVLKMPAFQQMQFVQEKEQELLKNGGNLHQAAALNRLKQTVKKNVELLNDTPILFNANRNGVDVQPINAAEAAANPDDFAKVLSGRITEIMGMRKQQGYNVPMRPLLPEEVAQYSHALNTSSVEDQQKMLTQFFEATQSTEGYMGVMAQLAPDAPVKAQAGMLAAKDAQLETKKWFSPNKSVTSQQVAETMLRGEAIINPPKDVKAQDGSPKLSLYLPDENPLKLEFAKTVGEAYALAPNVMQSDYQAVKAYYVGKASLTGKLASDKTDVDPALVKEAVRNVVGNVTDYNGRGKVTIPWGMSETTFNDRTRAALALEITRRGIDPSLLAQSLQMGLMRVQGDNYMFTIGKDTLKDPKTGQAIVINVSKPMVVGKKAVAHGRGVTAVEDVIE